MPEQLFELTASEAAALIRRRELSPVELTRALLNRIEETDGAVRAWTTVDSERALSSAREAEAHPSERPLHGVPFGAKDIYFSSGLRTTASFGPFAGFVPAEDAEAIARLKAAGGILLGKTATTQFALADPAPTTNPWKADRTPGGSSSGSGAAVAARQVPFALGTQTAGSVLRPAAFCGVMGFKPSFGLISRRGVFPLSWTLDHIGVLCRSVDDAALALRIMGGHDPADPYCADVPAETYVEEPEQTNPAKPVLGLVRDYLERAEPDVRHALEGAAARLEQSGAQVREITLPNGLDVALAAQYLILRSEAAAVHAHLVRQHEADYGPRLRQAIEAGALIPAPAYVHALRLRRVFKSEVAAAMMDVEALLCPTVGNVAPDRSGTGEASFQAAWTMIGLPTISLPHGLSGDGLPFAVQLAGRRFQDARLLAIARWAETVLGPMPAPPIP